MEWLILVAAVVIVWLWGKLKDFMWSKANQHVFSRGDHRRGQELIKTAIQFRCPNAAVSVVRRSILDAIPVSGGGKWLTDELHLIEDSSDGKDWTLGYSFGSKTGESFRTGVFIFWEEEGSSGFIAVLEGTLSDGVMINTDELGNWRHDVVEAIRQADSSVEFSEASLA